MTPEERLYRNYLDALNHHDLDAVMQCFHETPVFVEATGSRLSDRREVRHAFKGILESFVEGRVELREWKYEAGVGVSEWSFNGASRWRGAVKSVGADVIWIRDGKLSEVHVYFQPVLLDHESQPKSESPQKLAPAGSRVYR